MAMWLCFSGYVLATQVDILDIEIVYIQLQFGISIILSHCVESLCMKQMRCALNPRVRE